VSERPEPDPRWLPWSDPRSDPAGAMLAVARGEEPPPEPDKRTLREKIHDAIQADIDRKRVWR
jgi:hypothetical protein